MPDPTNEVVAAFEIPIFFGQTESPSGVPIEVSATLPPHGGGPGGERIFQTLNSAAAVLTAFSGVFEALPAEQQQSLQQEFGVPPGAMANYIASIVNYLKYFDARDQLLLDGLTKLMNLTKCGTTAACS